MEVEVIIVDDKSTDDRIAVARSIKDRDERVRLILHEQIKGHIATYNDGLDGDDAGRAYPCRRTAGCRAIRRSGLRRRFSAAVCLRAAPLEEPGLSGRVLIGCVTVAARGTMWLLLPRWPCGHWYCERSVATARIFRTPVPSKCGCGHPPCPRSAFWWVWIGVTPATTPST
ncbi:glycosyltransferase [Sinorhizobium meliloti]|uniref:glycosyltransferase n=1 Tax=Rhizobium meliloti TaxID=382 RepID=UPI0013216B5C|nr:glycosyltransferase [Sinorhizobium meliloti]MDE4560684.1 glycosyltransferase [Sinorhizobium meliloti SM11]MDW9446184.1 glycosyltransferase [Sinorhizobium meliloti]MDW9659697.1 glycosyltransferase [Sinorhizobium meliloti]MDX0048886.1 glycosyltransferase [Sinorhizobium meliloti]MQX44312.1 glycosyltransferase [Sinorhizobium meliloti]